MSQTKIFISLLILFIATSSLRLSGFASGSLSLKALLDSEISAHVQNKLQAIAET